MGMMLFNLSFIAGVLQTQAGLLTSQLAGNEFLQVRWYKLLHVITPDCRYWYVDDRYQLHHDNHEDACTRYDIVQNANVHLVSTYRQLNRRIRLPGIYSSVGMGTMDRLFDTNFFATGDGGMDMLWANLFWVWGHPEVYILILPAFGIFS